VERPAEAQPEGKALRAAERDHLRPPLTLGRNIASHRVHGGPRGGVSVRLAAAAAPQSPPAEACNLDDGP